MALAILTTLLCGPWGTASTRPWDVPKREGPLLVAMATCKSVRCVKATYAKIAKPENVARIVYYTNLLRLNPRDRAASCGLLANMPRDENEYSRLLSLATNLYEGETDADIVAVGQSFWHMSRNLACALRACPRYLPAFIRYGAIAASDASEDDYGDWAARVCLSDPGRFLKAFETLSPKDRDYIAKYVIQPKGCKQIATHEAD